ncbi:MAG: YkgJ family cysteine cluster protein [Anaerolineae bacterium]|nr:YkgJ family cysteine cluster protein [Anaerolineae bacterium]
MDDEFESPASCDGCGACCYLVVQVPEPGDIAACLLTHQQGQTWMRREGGGRCAALDPSTHRCTIYAQRPPDCRNFDLGSAHCLIVRQAFFSGLRGSKLIKAYVKGVKKLSEKVQVAQNRK